MFPFVNDNEMVWIVSIRAGSFVHLNYSYNLNRSYVNK